MTTTIHRSLRDAILRLNQAHVDSPATTARAVLSSATGRPREWLVAHDDESLDGEAQARLNVLLSRVLAHEPLAYVLGHREFYGLDFHVKPCVLIPRPETELLVEFALADLSTGGHSQTAGEAGRAASVDLIDVGTGSGAVAVAVRVHAPSLRVIATDISMAALVVARENAALHGVSDCITFVESDLLAGVSAHARTITANLPYVTVEEIEALPPEIQAHEPRVALDGGRDGLDLIRRLLTQLDEHLHPGGSAYFEIGGTQGPAALQAAQQVLPGWHVHLRHDLAGLDRVLQVTRPPMP